MRNKAMDVDHPERDAQWNWDVRGETSTERLDRNWNALLQELRVLQTGVQLLTGFLLILPFQEGFEDIPQFRAVVYLVTVTTSAVATVVLVAPVATHRLLFRRHRLPQIVARAHRLAIVGLVLLGAALVGVTMLIFDAIVGTTAAIVAGVIAAVVVTGVWLVQPWFLRVNSDEVEDPTASGRGGSPAAG